MKSTALRLTRLILRLFPNYLKLGSIIHPPLYCLYAFIDVAVASQASLDNNFRAKHIYSSRERPFRLSLFRRQEDDERKTGLWRK